ncbi:MAG: FecR family protein [Tannerella sp.]|jgi:ferric-dicitrate binding protein FerR (iron transport regulator)|nr:FecR family protein [Tannerella sp.]
MEKGTLYNFFEGIASADEKAAVKRWLDTDPQNREELIKEREFFNALILSDTNRFVPVARKKSPSMHLLREALKVAAIVAIVVAGGVYFHKEKMNDIRSATHTITVPAGQRANIRLSDGTNVWLNARSELKYPAFFAQAKREIELNGEAYFEVAHDKHQPFVVHTGKCDIEVLGTSFNVEAYDGSDDFSAALIKGSVKVTDRNHPENTLTLRPDNKVELRDGVFVASSIDDFDYYRWREGLICFKDLNFIELMYRFEKCYGVKIVIANKKLEKHVFSGKFRISDGIDNALRVLQKDIRYTYKKDPEEPVIYIK